MEPVSRREFLCTSGVVVAGVFVPDWAGAFQAGASDDARRAEVADAALSHAAKLGASYADIRVNRYRRESISTREQQVQNVSRTTIVQDAWRRGHALQLHGWIYGLKDGLITDLGMAIDR